MRPVPYSGFVIVGSHDAVRPSATWGTTVTPGNNTYGSYATVLGTPLASDAYGIEIIIGGTSVSAAINDSLTTIGIDSAGGTSYVDLIPHLLVTGSTNYGTNGTGPSITYYFPLRIPAGSTIGAKGSNSNATVGTQQVAVRLFTRPTNMRGVPRYGSFVVTFGEDTANSCGTAVTAGTVSEGTYTQLGSAIAAPGLFCWNVAASPKNNAAWGGGVLVTDLAHGDASNKIPLIQDQAFGQSTTESGSAYYKGFYGLGPPGSLVYVRCQQGSGITGVGAIAYGVGG